MGGGSKLLSLVAVVLTANICVTAQSAAQQRAVELRTRLAEVIDQQNELRMRIDQLSEEIKPENIEHSLAGIGSTHPEDLREQRRHQLESQITAAKKQLEQLNANRSRLERAVADADAQAYQQSANPDYVNGASQITNPGPVTPVQRPRRVKHKARRRPVTHHRSK